MDTDNGVVMARRKRGRVQVEVAKEGEMGTSVIVPTIKVKGKKDCVILEER